MADLVAVAESAKTRYTSLADRMARLYSPSVHILALGAFLSWLLLTHDLRLAINIAAAVLIITCPCALALAVPAVVTSASGRLFRKGLLIKDGTALERLAEVDTVVFDKTGTLTLGAPTPLALDRQDPRDLSLVAALAGVSGHPLSRALDAALSGMAVTPTTVTDAHEVPGYGVEARWQGQAVRLGRAEWVGGGESEETATWLRIGDAAPVGGLLADLLHTDPFLGVDGAGL